MFRSILVRTAVVVTAVAAVACCSAVARAEKVSPLAAPAVSNPGLVGSLGAAMPDDAAHEASAAVMRSFVSDQTVAYSAALATPTFGSQVVRTASGMGFGFETVPFESFLSVAAAPDGENVIRTFIIIKSDRSDSAEPSLGKKSNEQILDRFTQSSFGSTTTSGSATLSILQVPPASSSLVFTNVLLKDGAQVTE